MESRESTAPDSSSRTGLRFGYLTQILALSLGTVLTALASVQTANAQSCGQTAEVAAARVRWAAVRQSRVDPANNEKTCRAYGIHFYEAATARQAISACKDGIGRQPILDALDAEIDAFNNLIAAQCRG